MPRSRTGGLPRGRLPLPVVGSRRVSRRSVGRSPCSGTPVARARGGVRLRGVRRRTAPRDPGSPRASCPGPTRHRVASALRHLPSRCAPRRCTPPHGAGLPVTDCVKMYENRRFENAGSKKVDQASPASPIIDANDTRSRTAYGSIWPLMRKLLPSMTTVSAWCSRRSRMAAVKVLSWLNILGYS